MQIKSLGAVFQITVYFELLHLKHSVGGHVFGMFLEPSFFMYPYLSSYLLLDKINSRYTQNRCVYISIWIYVFISSVVVILFSFDSFLPGGVTPYTALNRVLFLKLFVLVC